jgi:hypothetical protein
MGLIKQHQSILTYTLLYRHCGPNQTQRVSYSYLYTTSAGLRGEPSSPETTPGPSTDLAKDDGSSPASTGLPNAGVKDEAVEAALPSSLCSITVGIAGMLSHTLHTDDDKMNCSKLADMLQVCPYRLHNLNTGICAYDAEVLLTGSDNI